MSFYKHMPIINYNIVMGICQLLCENISTNKNSTNLFLIFCKNITIKEKDKNKQFEITNLFYSKIFIDYKET